MDKQLVDINQRKLEEEKLRLEELLSRFAHRQDTSERENFKTDFPNVGGSADENALKVEIYEANLGEEQALEAKLQKINAALSRIAAGTYGKCAVGGEEIEAPRLRVVPEAETCVRHSS